eukprot:g3272.t1
MTGKRPSLGKPLISGGNFSWRDQKAALQSEIKHCIQKFKRYDEERFQESGRSLLSEILRESGVIRTNNSITIKGITQQLHELEEVARSADRSEIQLSSQELMELKQFVVTNKNKMEDMAEALKLANRKALRGERNDLFGSGSGVGESKNIVSGGGIGFSSRVQERRTLEAEQDEAMDGIDQKLGVLHGHATTVFSQLEAQNKLIDGLNEDVSEAQRAFDRVNEKLGTFMQTTDRCQTTTACVLIGVLIGVLMLYAFFW